MTDIAPPDIDGIRLPDSEVGRAVTQYIRDTESDLLFNHSARVYYFGAIAGKRRALTFDPDLLYAACMFHDIGLMPGHRSDDLRFEVDSANAAWTFLAGHGVVAPDLERVWTAIALHTTPGIPQFMHPVVALTTAGVEMDVLGVDYDLYSGAVREEIVAAFPRSARFKEDIINAFYGGIKHRPATTFGNVKADVIADKEPHFYPLNFCSMIRNSRWAT